MDDLKTKFLDIKGADNYQRVDTSHLVPWYIGIDGRNRYSLFVVVDTQPDNISSTKMIGVYIGIRRDRKYGITFSLLDKENLDLFIHFCSDMISSSSIITSLDKAADFICTRYIKWQKAFVKTEGRILSFSQIKGLLGELCFLKMKLIPEYGVEYAVDSWSGMEYTDQDFTCADTWYEVKATVSGSTSVKISSVEQLDVDKDGHLVVVRLDKTSNTDSSKLTLNNMVNMVVENISSPVVKENLLGRLVAYGYYFDKAYDKIGFKYNGMEMYKINHEFPCLRKQHLPTSVQNIKYDLSLSVLKDFREI